MIELPDGANMRAYQDYIHRLESEKGWLEVDLVHTCFLMGEEVGELFKAVRKVNHLFDQGETPQQDRHALVAEVGDEIIDVLNYLLAVANRLEIDVEQAFRSKNTLNQKRHWD